MKRTVRIAVLTATALTSSVGLAGGAAVKLPHKLTSPTGNFFTLYAFDQPTASQPVASALMQVCASSHTPEPNTYIDPELFTLKLSNGKTVKLAKGAAHSPPLQLQHLNRLQCSTKGWISFDVPKGATAATLEYDFNGTISWAVG
jgi:hypothetical protein